jgi:hypothetical protein
MTLVSGKREPGDHQILLDASHLASGTYLCRLRSGNRIVTRKLILAR